MKLCDFGFARAVGQYMQYVHMIIVSVYSTFGVYIYLQCVSTIHAVCIIYYYTYVICLYTDSMYFTTL